MSAPSRRCWGARPDIGSGSGRDERADFADTIPNAAGLPPDSRFHDLRHFYASLLIASGADVKVVQARLRHASAKTTLDTYGHLWPDSDDSTRAAIDAALEVRSVGAAGVGAMSWPEMRNVGRETFKALDAETRKLVLRMLDQPTEADHDALQRHPNCQMLSSWLLNLPAYENAPDDDAE